MGEKIIIVGYRDVNFTDDSGKVIEGRSYYYTSASDGVVGVVAGKLFVGINTLRDLKYKPAVGDETMVFFSRYGKPSGFTKATA